MCVCVCERERESKSERIRERERVYLIIKEIAGKDHNFYTRVVADVNSFRAMKKLIAYVIAVLR